MGENPVDRRSVGAYTFLLGNGVVSWRSKKQSVTSRSSAEAEYRALADASCEVIWLKNLLIELGVNIKGLVSLFCDSKSAVDLTVNHVYHASTKHIEIDCHFIREKIQPGLINVSQISTKVNTADILTKGLGKVPHWSCCSKLGIVSFSMPYPSGEQKHDDQMAGTYGLVICSNKSCNNTTEDSVQRGANEHNKWSLNHKLLIPFKPNKSLEL